MRHLTARDPYTNGLTPRGGKIIDALRGAGFHVTNIDNDYCFDGSTIPNIIIGGYFVDTANDNCACMMNDMGAWVIRKPPEVKRILKSGNRTIVFWDDGTKTIVKRAADEAESDYAAFTAAVAIRAYGSNSALKRMIEQKVEIQKKRKKK